MASTVMEYSYLQFDDNWTLTGPGEIAEYTATVNGAEVKVVTVGPTGLTQTYWFNFNTGNVVVTSTHENVVHLPARRTKREYGDHS